MKFSVGKAIGDAFGLIRSRPVSVFVWGLLLVGPMLAITAIMFPMLASLPVAETQTEEDMGPVMAQMMQFQLWSALLQLVQMLSMAVIYAAIFRAILRPAERSWFSLRLGMDEVRIAVVGLAIGVGIYILAILMVLVGVMLGFAVHSLVQPSWPFITLMILGFLGVFFWLLARTSLMAPASLMRRDFAFVEGWKLAKGQSLRLFGMMVLIVLIVLMIELVILVIGFALFAALNAGGLANFERAMEDSHPQVLGDVLPSLATAWPWLVGGGLVASFFYGIFFVLTAAPYASACKQLSDRAPGGDIDPEPASDGLLD